MRKVLHFSNKPAFPLRDGGCIAISSILHSLLATEEIEVFHFTLSTYKHPYAEEAYPEEWRGYMKMDSAFINTKTSVVAALKHLVTNKSYNVSRFYSKDVEQKLEKILKTEKFDIALLESIYLLPYLPLFKKHQVKVVLRTHNVEHRIWNSLASNTHSLIKRRYLRILAKQLKSYELAECAKVDGIISITETDALFFQQFEPHVQTTAIPPMIVMHENSTNYDLSDFYFLGAMDWQPNIEGIQWFLDEVIPEGLVGTEFYLAGKSLEPHKYKHPSVINVGEVESAPQFIHEHGICLIPVHAGSGLKIKLLENMSIGKPIITTSEGARGVGVRHEVEVLIADDSKEFREAMYRLNLDKDLRRQLGENARTFIENNYSKEKLTRRLIAFLRDI